MGSRRADSLARRISSEIENYRRAKHRAREAATSFVARARQDGAAALVAHGYFNLLIGRELRQRGFKSRCAPCPF